jgi:hypothetical protein
MIIGNKDLATRHYIQDKKITKLSSKCGHEHHIFKTANKVMKILKLLMERINQFLIHTFPFCWR